MSSLKIKMLCMGCANVFIFISRKIFDTCQIVYVSHEPYVAKINNVCINCTLCRCRPGNAYVVYEATAPCTTETTFPIII